LTYSIVTVSSYTFGKNYYHYFDTINYGLLQQVSKKNKNKDLATVLSFAEYNQISKYMVIDF
jgi:hypothetical protein